VADRSPARSRGNAAALPREASRSARTE
jgi:hypothetical protein